MGMGSRDAVLVVNSGSRSGRRDFEVARRRLTELGLPLAGAHALDDPGELPGVVDDAIAAGARLLVVGGGDGTVSLLASRLARADVVLGLLPTGTANDLARTLRVPTDLAAACDVVVNGRVARVDLGRIGDDAFVNVASVGLAAGVTRALSPRLKRTLGAAAYPVAAVRAYRRHRPFRARLEFPDGDHEPVDLDDLLQVAVANGRFYGGGNVVAPDAGIDDQLLDVYAIPRGTAWQRWQVARHFVSGAFVENDHVLHLTTRSVRLITEPALPINVDGELSASTPELFGLLGKGLEVMVPDRKHDLASAQDAGK
jgi:diacylglycerol kinase (ATP)